MDKQQIIDFMNANPVCHIATGDHDQPRVRMVMIYNADENGVVFITGAKKDLQKQLTWNQKAEMCFYSPESNMMVRVAGTCEIVDDDAVKNAILDKFSFLKSIAERQGLGAFVVWRLPHGTATTWTQKTAFDPKTEVEL